MKSVIDKKQIHAPFDGTAGIRAVNPGQMVKWVINWFHCRRWVRSLSIFPCRNSSWRM